MRLKRGVGRLIVAGCGPHFFAAYLSVLEQFLPLTAIELAIDLVGRESEIRRTFASSKIQPKGFLFLPESCRNRLKLNELQTILSSYPNAMNAEGIVICTEPKAHLVFALWALDRRIPVFMDKPISAFPLPSSTRSIEDDYRQLLKKSDDAKTPVTISCERRVHYGYRYVEQFLQRFIATHHVPITFLNVHFAGGIWVMPWEYELIENHPLKYGYGVLFHSGYHYIDLVARLAELNAEFMQSNLDRPRVKALASFPKDITSVISVDAYDDIFKDRRIKHRVQLADKKTFDGYGEVDIAAIGTYSCSNKKSLDFSLQLCSTSVSARQTPRRDSVGDPTYGRVRQEHIIIHLGNLCTVTISSSPMHKLAADTAADHFDIVIAQNPLLVKAGPSLTMVDREDLSKLFRELSSDAIMNLVARQHLLREFLAGNEGVSDLSTHDASITLMSEIISALRV